MRFVQFLFFRHTLELKKKMCYDSTYGTIIDTFGGAFPFVHWGKNKQSNYSR